MEGLMNKKNRASGAALLIVAALLAVEAMGADRTIGIQDYTGRGFAPDRVQYSFRGSAKQAEKLRLFDAAGKALPLQVSRTDSADVQTLSFVAEVAPNEKASYRVANSGGRAAPGVSVQKSKEYIEVGNSILSIRLPPEGAKKYSPGAEARLLPAPILAFRGGAGDWRGASSILTARKVEWSQVRIVAEGPVFAEVAYELRWEGGGYYRAVFTVIDRVPLVKVREEYDLGGLDGTDFWELNLSKGWAPDRMEIAKTHGNGSGIDMGKVVPLADLAGMPQPRITPDTCPPSLSQLGLFRDEDQKANPGAYAMAGVVPLRKGDWRKMNAIPVASTGAQDVRVQFPMTARHAMWVKDTASETSPFSMTEHEPGLSRTYGRRHWGLVLAAPAVTNAEKSTVRFTYFQAPQPLAKLGPFAQARSFYGVVGLDRYKDYILEWPDGDLKFPRLYGEPGTPAVKEGPQGPTPMLVGLCNAPITCPVISHHLTAGTYVTAAEADATMARTNLTPEVRAEMRARLALIMYLFEEADFISYANGAHSGNPNMGTCRYMGANAFLPLVADHPMFEKWRAHVAGYTEYKMASQVAPGGSYLEFGTSYHMHGYSRTTCSLPGLVAAGAPNVKRLYEAYHKPDWDYFMNLLTPLDWRNGTRMFPGLANAGPGQVGHFAEAAGSFARMDPAFAGALTWAWQENGSPKPENPWIVRGDIQSVPQALTSRVFPGFGAVLRAHQGPNETYLLLRSGFDWSHWYIDQGHMVAMSRGAVLLPFQPYAYWDSPNKSEFDLYNTIRFGHPKNEFPYDWPDGNVLDYAFGDTVDYVWASTGLPDWFIRPGVNPAVRPDADANFITGQIRALSADYPQTEGAFEWNRQVLLLKGKTATSPNYFVIRDSMPGAGKLAGYLFLNLLGRKENLAVEGDRIAVDTDSETKLDIVFTDPGQVTPTFYEERQPLTFRSATPPARPVRDWVDKEGKPLAAGVKQGAMEQHVFLRVPQAPGAGYLWVLYPRGAGEAKPTIQSLAPGVVKIIHPEGEDMVFVSSSHMKYGADGMDFEGCAGAVRTRDGKVTLALAAGQGRVAARGCELSGIGPLERTFPEPGKHAPAAAAPSVAFNADVAGGREVAPGVTEVKNGDTTRYVINAAEPVLVGSGGLTIEASRAEIHVTPAAIRFVVPDALYAKLAVTNVGVRGVGPFDLTFARDRISGKVGGRMRTIVTTWPADITKPAFHLDGIRYFAGWADDHCIGKGMATPQFSVAFGVTDGPHDVTIAEWEYPALPPDPPRGEL